MATADRIEEYFRTCDEEEKDISISMNSAAINGETDSKVCELDNKNASDSDSDSEDDHKNIDDEDDQNDDVGEETIIDPDHERDTTHDNDSRQPKSLLPASTDAEKKQYFDCNDSFEVDESHKKPLHIVDTWESITKRDRPLSDKDSVRVTDHSMAMLGERICEATNDRHFRESLKAFEHTLGRFRNSEIELGNRIASGSFADVYRIRSFRREEKAENYTPIEDPHAVFTRDLDLSCSGLQAKTDEIVKRHKPDEYVVKVLRKNLLINPKLFATAAADFITEGTLLASFDHPHILSIRGRSIHGVEGFSTGKRDAVFFVLERMDGDLTHRVYEWKKRTSQYGLFAKGRKNFNMSILRERLVLMSNLAAALSYLHERNVIHRDISLSNVGISAGEGTAKLLDFGLAKVLPHSTNENERFLLTGTTGSMR